MGDLKVRRKSDHSDVQEMSEYSFQLLRSEFELVPPTPGKRPVIAATEPPKVEIPRGTSEPTREELIAEYEKVFGLRPHGRMKDETMKANIEEEKKKLD